MSKIGLHFSAYQSMDYLERFLKPWIEFKKNNDLIISAGHVCFKEFQEMGFPIESKDNTHEKLEEFHKNKEIDYYRFITDPLTEAEARTKILEPLLNRNIDLLWIAGVDEFYTICEIEETIKYVQKDPFIAWFRIHYKNIVFDNNTFIKGFCPGRIFRTKVGRLMLVEMYYDDDVIYIDGCNKIDYKSLPSKKIPEHIINPLHITWLNNERSRIKVEYQIKHFSKQGVPSESACSFKWNYNSNSLEWNEKYYSRNNISVPELFTLKSDV